MNQVAEVINSAPRCRVCVCGVCGIEACDRCWPLLLEGWGVSKPDEVGWQRWLCPNCQTEQGSVKESLYEASIKEILEKMNEADKMIRDRLSLGESSDMHVTEKDAFKESRLLIQQAINKLLGR